MSIRRKSIMSLLDSANRICTWTRVWSSEIRRHDVSLLIGWVLTIIFALYIVAVLTAHSSSWKRPPIILWPIWTSFVMFVIVKAGLSAKHYWRNFNPSHCQIISQRKLGVIVFLIYVAWLVMAKSFGTNDTWTQMRQVREFCFSDWHPILHTFTMWLITRLCERLVAIVLVQIVVFSVLIAWAYKSLLRIVEYRMSLIIILLVAFNPINFQMLRGPHKDVAFALTTLGLTVSLVNAVMSRGEWFKDMCNLFLFVAFLFLSTFYRHNGIFLTVPLCFLLASWRVPGVIRLRILAALLAFAMLSVGYLGIKHSAFLVNRHIIDIQSDSGQRYAESIGLLMCGISEAYMNSYERTPEDARLLMAHHGERNNLKEAYGGDYNSIKFSMDWTSENSPTKVIVRYSTPKSLLKTFISTAKSAPGAVAAAIRRVTAMVWDPMFSAAPIVGAGSLIGRELSWPANVLMSTPVGCLFGSIGFWMLLLVGIATIGYIFRGWSAWLLSLPMLCYGFGTMCLLCGHDWRFFYAIVLCAPISVAGLLRDARCCSATQSHV